MTPDDLVDALARNAFHVMGLLTRIGAAHDLSLTQLRVLGILRDRRARVTELADHLGLDKSTLSGLIDRAERRGLLARGRNDADKRVVEVFMTPAGLALAEVIWDEVRAAMSPLVEGLTPEQRERLVRLLDIRRPRGPAGA